MEGSFLQDLAVVVLAAGLVTVLFHQLRQPVVLGYILAGVLIGPKATNFALIQSQANIQTLSQLGVVLLMFSLGLQFSFRRLMRVGATAGLAGTLEILLMVSIGYGVGRVFGWSRMDSVFLGAMLLSSSSIIIVKTLNDLKLAKQKFAEIIFGITVVEDLFAIAAIALLSGIAQAGSLSVKDVVFTGGRMVIFLTTTLVTGLILIPYLLRYVVRFKSDEMLLVTVLGLAFGVAILAAKLGYSVALGAFLIGAIMAETRERGRIEALILPVRDMFSAIFFVAIGMLFDPHMLAQHWVPVLVVMAVLIIGKTHAAALGAFVAGNDVRTSLRVGMGLTQIGEFAFIITQLGMTLKVTSDFLYPIAVSVASATTLITPYLIKHSDSIVDLMARPVPKGVSSYLQIYTHWVARLSSGSRGTTQIRQLMRKWMLQIGLNLALVAGLLIGAATVARHSAAWQADVPSWTGGARSAIWLSAMLLALPLLIATMRKVRAVAMVLAEMSVARSAAREHTPAIRSVVGNVILAFGTLGVALWVILLSAALLPPWPVTVVLMLILAVVTAILWKSFIQIYAKAQIALRETLTTAPPVTLDAHRTLPTILHDAELETLPIMPQSPAAGKLIRELQLRTRTGASAVGIERNGNSIINPGPDEELQAGDKVLLLGNPAQLAAARKLLAGKQAS